MNSKAEENQKFCNAINNIREVIKSAQRDILHGDDDERANGMITINVICAALTKAHDGDLSILQQRIVENQEQKKETIQ